VDEAILTNGAGKIVEGSSTNIFLFDGKQWITPPHSDGPLLGITRKTVIELCKKNGIPCVEKSITTDQLTLAQEIILTNSIKEILPLTRVNYQTIGNGKIGEQTRRLQELFRDEIQYRIESFDSKRWRVEMFS
jgi:branched-chain amino acid aminotransferase